MSFLYQQQSHFPGGAPLEKTDKLNPAHCSLKGHLGHEWVTTAPPLSAGRGHALSLLPPGLPLPRGPVEVGVVVS